MGKFGNAAEAAIPVLITKLTHYYQRAEPEAGWALAKIGAAAVPALIAALPHENPAFAMSISLTLGAIGAPAVPSLVAALDHPLENVRWEAARALNEIGAAGGMPPVASRWRSMTAVGTCGSMRPKHWARLESPRQSPSRLVARLADEDVTVRQNAVKALGQIGSPLEVVMPALNTALHDANENVVREAARSLGRIGPSAYPILLSAFASTNHVVRGYVAQMLGEIGPPAEPAIPALIDALADPAANIRYLSAIALGRIGPQAEAAVPGLVAALADADASVRCHSADALGRIGRPAELVVPALISALAGQDDSVRHRAAEALGGLDGPAELLVPALIQLLAEERDVVRTKAAEVLTKIGEHALPALNNARFHPDAMIGSSATQILAQIAPDMLSSGGKGQKPKGIERTGDEAFRLIGELEVFYWIGALCRQRRTDAFSFTDLEAVLPDLVTLYDSLSNASIRRHVEKVSDFFHAYYKKYEGIDVPEDGDRMAADGDKFVTRYTGAKRQTIGTVGWTAWKETKRYLTARGIPLKPISRKY